MLENLNIEKGNIDAEKIRQYTEIFLKKNSQLNLISKNDEKFLFEKHIYDSLALNLFLKPKKGERLLDIGTGGGFPSVPLAIFYKDLKITAVDSIRKKINAVQEFKQTLNLDNLTVVCDRVENLDMTFDYVVSRAVASLDKILSYAIPHIKNGGYFIAYKSKKYDEELNKAQKIIRENNLSKPEIISYNLPLEEIFERHLIVFRKL